MLKHMIEVAKKNESLSKFMPNVLNKIPGIPFLTFIWETINTRKPPGSIIFIFLIALSTDVIGKIGNYLDIDLFLTQKA